VPPDGLALRLNARLGVETSGGNVTAWHDVSGNGHMATQGTPAAQPTLQPNVMEAKPVVHFDGGDSLVLPTPSDLGIQGQDYEMFIVARSASSAIQFLIAGDKEDYEIHLNGDAGARFIPNGYSSGAGASDLGAATDYTDGEPHIFAARLLAGTGHAGIVRVDGVESTDLTAFDGRSSANDPLLLGQREDGSYRLSGDIAEVLIYDRVLTAAERRAVEDYLRLTWITPEPASIVLVAGGLVALLRRRGR
jgi:hypothetical protein